MQQSSESIAALATALAKAQIELVNPEKALTATIRLDRNGQTERTFRYASLSSGLDIVRNTLGRHEIAILQATAVDRDTRTVSLRTTLTHSSGEWVASDWPVCYLAELSAPQRMGAALTYARRYALFTLVGIAGEDDLDAPDLQDGGRDGRAPRVSTAAMPIANGAYSPARANGRPVPNHSRPALDSASSATERDKLLAELGGLGSEADFLAWAQRTLKAKNTLDAADARAVELAFGEKAKAFLAEPDATGNPQVETEPSTGESNNTRTSVGEDASAAHAIDKMQLPIATPRRLRDKAHLKFVATRSCLICARKPSDPHHLRFAQPRALARKVSDEFTVPLCRTHHRALHHSGNEPAWWNEAGIDPLKVAQRLWNKTRSSSNAAKRAKPKRSAGADPDGAYSLRSV